MSEHRPRPLDGVRVISLGAFVAGNWAGQALVELGAEVVKVEAHDRPEVLRTPAYAFGQPYTEPSGIPQTVMYGTMSRGTRGLSIDLQHEAARPVFRELAKRAHVVVENIAGPTLARWGCAYPDLARANPSLVWLSLSGYGRTGPRANYLAYATNISSYTGLTDMWGLPHPMQSDYVSAQTGVVAVLAGLAEAERSGTGVYLDVAQIDAMTPLMTPLLVDPLVNGRDTVRHENRVPGAWFSGVFPARGHDAWLAIELEDAEDWQVLCRVLDRPDLSTADPDEAAARDGTLEAALVEWLAERSPHTATHLLQKAGLAAGTVQTPEDIWRDPQLRTRGFIVELPQPDYGTINYPGSPYRLSATPGRIDRGGPRLGEHTNAVLQEWLGLDEAELASLASSGAIYQAPEEGRAP